MESLETTRTSTSALTASRWPAGLPPELRTAFELFTRAGLDPDAAVALAIGGTTAAEAKRLLADLLARSGSVADFGPKAVAVSVLARAIANGGESGRDLRASIAAHAKLYVVRPDGYIARALTGEAVEKAGPLSMDGDALRAGKLVVGAFHAAEGGILYPTRPDLSVDRDVTRGFELSVDRMVVGRVLDGADDAMKSMILAVGDLITQPVRTVEGMLESLGRIGEIIHASPEATARFLAMPFGDQVEFASKIAMTVALSGGAMRAGAAMGSSAGAGLGQITIELGQAGQAVAGLALQFDLSALATGALGGGLVAAGAAGLLAEWGPDSSLPDRGRPPEAPREARRVARRHLALRALEERVRGGPKCDPRPPQTFGPERSAARQSRDAGPGSRLGSGLGPRGRSRKRSQVLRRRERVAEPRIQGVAQARGRAHRAVGDRRCGL
jgi:hypothetical protein